MPGRRRVGRPSGPSSGRLVSLLIGARTKELRALTWSHVDPTASQIPPSIMVWRSVRKTGDTKTMTSRRTLAMPQRCADALKAQRARQDVARKAAGDCWQNNDLVFASRVGTRLDAANVPARVPEGGHQGRTTRQGLDAARATAQLRVAAVRRWDVPGADFSRSQRDDRHGGGLPVPDQAGSSRGRHSDRPDLPE
jgi:integrase